MTFPAECTGANHHGWGLNGCADGMVAEDTEPRESSYSNSDQRKKAKE